ncbi:unnamed protein product [Echinostoma caproni]|uniref:Mediator of RNA polymerase II transcription subunit 23 n=1 Tax=Echinostoma caproni TaxID=27848 RepID=A0A183AFJ7_9TREM|nr:unnamed protein product [Echinostoma caproni]
MQLTDSDPSERGTSKPAFHPDPVSSRHWTTCLFRLHELIPDQWMTWNPSFKRDTASACASASSSRSTLLDNANAETRPNPSFPVLYGHMVVRLLPMLEAILAHFIETELPLVRLIPFCRAVTPLFRFHRRPVNTSFVLLREHWHFVPPDADGSNADNQLTWFIGRLRMQLVTHCVLSRTHTLAVHRARSRKLNGPGADIEAQSGLLTQRGWSELCASVEVAKETYTQLLAKYTDEARFWAEAEPELEAMLYDWYNAHVTCADSEFVSTLLNPIILSTHKFGLYGHPAAWRPWNLEENVSIQAAGLYAAAVEIMSSYTTPKEFVAAMTDFLLPGSVGPDTGDCVNVLGALTALLPNAYRMAICQFATSLLVEDVMTNPIGSPDWSNQLDECYNSASQWHRSSRIRRHARWLDPDENESHTDLCPSPPAVAVNFFKDFLPPQQSSADTDKRTTGVELNSKNSKDNSLFTELIVPYLTNEAQLLMAFYLVAPLMGSLHSERAAKLIELTAHLYRAVAQVDALLGMKGGGGAGGPGGESNSAGTDQDAESDTKPKQIGVPMVHVDTVADLLYHIKYMYVGNGVLDQVQPLLPKLRPNLRKRLKFILPPTEMFNAPGSAQSGAQAWTKPSQAFPGEMARAVYEGRPTFDPQVEYAIQAWKPWLQRDREILEHSQSMATKVVKGLEVKTNCGAHTLVGMHISLIEGVTGTNMVLFCSWFKERADLISTRQICSIL